MQLSWMERVENCLQTVSEIVPYLIKLKFVQNLFTNLYFTYTHIHLYKYLFVHHCCKMYYHRVKECSRIYLFSVMNLPSLIALWHLIKNWLFKLNCRYASLYFCCAIEQSDNELLTLEIIHRYVELLDKYFGSVSNILLYHRKWWCYLLIIMFP